MTAITEKLKKAVFKNDIDAVEVIYRMSQGNKVTAYRTIRDAAAHYGMTDLTDLEIDTAIGELNDGFEMEWPS